MSAVLVLFTIAAWIVTLLLGILATRFWNIVEIKGSTAWPADQQHPERQRRKLRPLRAPTGRANGATRE